MADVVEDVKTTKIQSGALKDVLAVVKIGIVNSNLITTFTGLWLALHFTGKGFLSNLHTVFSRLSDLRSSLQVLAR